MTRKSKYLESSALLSSLLAQFVRIASAGDSGLKKGDPTKMIGEMEGKM